ncbi:hypothetical protein M3Y94_00340700 [Aphelenchoides besseyi]|nr:hypothetical protein M3Y94_00340700 [Aphelenchoides besseyi]KAI6235447.1 hypothetical protein M3Y95_00052600 [Aphelenchoides besseyi]
MLGSVNMNSTVKIYMRLLCFICIVGVIVEYGNCETEPQSSIADNTDEIYDESEVAEKRAGARPFVDMDANKRGGARSFQFKRAGGRGFGFYNNDLASVMSKRAGGRAFYGGNSGYNFGSSLYAPSYYEKKAAYVPYYLSEYKRGGARSFQLPQNWKRAGGRAFSGDQNQF